MRFLLATIILISFFGCENPKSTAKQKDAFKKKKNTLTNEQKTDDCIGCGNK